MSDLDDAKALVKSIISRGHLKLSDSDVAGLEAAPDGYVEPRRILAAHYFNIGQPAKSAEIARKVYTVARDAENASNLISALSRAGALDEAIAVALEMDCPLDEVRRASYLSELYARKPDLEKNREWSLKAFELKDAEARVIEDRPAPVIHTFDPDKPARNIIAYTLFGTGVRYVDGAIRNSIVCRHVYPGWTPRFYVDDSVPKGAIKELQKNGAQVRKVQGMPAERYGLFWRFLVEDDPEVDLYLVRDADSVPSIREAVAVHDWLASGQPFHVMRDFVTHSELVLAGLWGAHRGNIPGGMSEKIIAFAKTRSKVLNSRVDDQLFLRREIWPWMRGRVFVQDSVFGYGASAPFDPDYELPGRMHVGQDDHAFRTSAAKRRAVAVRAAKTANTPS